MQDPQLRSSMVKFPQGYILSRDRVFTLLVMGWTAKAREANDRARQIIEKTGVVEHIKLRWH
jgi:hypothetical protein